MQEKKFRIAVVNSHPIQYFAPLYAYLSRDPDIEVTALYCSDYSLRGAVDPGFKQAVTWDVDLLSGYRSVFLGKGAKTRRIEGFFSLVCPELWREIRAGNYDAVWLHGYGFAAYVLAFFAAKSRGVPVFVRSETHLGLRGSVRRRQLRDFVLSFAYRFVDGFLAIGSANRAYYRALGVSDQKIFDVPYTVDNDRFIQSAKLTIEERLQIRAKYNLPGNTPVVLYASKFMRRKHPDDVIEAVARLQSQGMKIALLMVGTGEMELELRAKVIELGVVSCVFGGFVNQAELPRVFAACDVFVLPAESEPWGLIVNEVMCAGIPVVVAKEVGCVPDLVKDGENGFHMIAGDAGSLADAISGILVNDEKRQAMGRRSLEIVKNWSYEQCRVGVKQSMFAMRSNA